MKKILFQIFLLSVALSLNVHSTGAYLSDTETVSGISITAGEWDVSTPTPTPSATPTPTPTVTPTEAPASTLTPTPSATPTIPSVVINEVMWMGSSKSTADEWIELKNMTDHEVEIGKWTIDNAKDNSSRIVILPASRTIPAHGYFLISNNQETSNNSALNVAVDQTENLELLNSGNGDLVLKDENGTFIDSAKGDVWPAGTNGTLNQSMERNETPGDGLLAASWHTCIDEHCNDTTYWDTEGNDYGTPKGPNLSDNDPSVTPGPTATPTSTPSPTPGPTPTPSPDITPTPTDAATPSASPTETPTDWPLPSATPSTSPTPDPTISPTETPAPTDVPTVAPTPNE